MRAATELDSKQARLKAREERRNLLALELFEKHRRSALINTVNLEHVIGDVRDNRPDLYSYLRERARSRAQCFGISSSTLVPANSPPVSPAAHRAAVHAPRSAGQQRFSRAKVSRVRSSKWPGTGSGV